MDDNTKKPGRIFSKTILAAGSNSMDSAAKLFIKLKITPNVITTIGLLVGAGSGALFALDRPLVAGILLIFCGFLDVIDGKVAHKTNKASLFGAIFDSTVDRYSEFFVYFGLAIHFRDHWALWIIFFTFLGSTMASYTRARAEGLNIECKVGIMQRAERMVMLSMGAIVGSLLNVFDPTLIAILGIIAVISNITALQRTFHVKKVEKRNEVKEKS
jgi:CDP-diacylglycerol--glycerol-3-phosphate 3-phosphatidyltransferase